MTSDNMSEPNNIANSSQPQSERASYGQPDSLLSFKDFVVADPGWNSFERLLRPKTHYRIIVGILLLLIVLVGISIPVVTLGKPPSILAIAFALVFIGAIAVWFFLKPLAYVVAEAGFIVVGVLLVVPVVLARVFLFRFLLFLIDLLNFLHIGHRSREDYAAGMQRSWTPWFWAGRRSRE